MIPPPTLSLLLTGNSTILVPRSIPRRRMPTRQKFIEEHKAQNESRMLERFQTREWKAGDIYAPHDLSPTEMSKWRKRSNPSADAFDALNLNPTDLYKVRARACSVGG